MTKTAARKKAKILPHSAGRPRVSVRSAWDDPEWHFDNPGPGRRPSAYVVSWGVLMSDGSSLLDPQWATLLENLKCFVWTLFHDKRRGNNLSAGSVSKIAGFIRAFAYWMALAGYRALDELEPSSGEEFLAHLEKNYAGPVPRGRPRTWDFSSAHALIGTYLMIHEQRLALVRFGIEIHPVAPFDGETAHSIVRRRLGFTREGSMESLSDDALVEILNTAFWFLSTPAADVIELQRRYFDAYQEDVREKSIVSGVASASSVLRLITETTFSVPDGSEAPWRGPLQPHSRTLTDGREVQVSGVQLIRRLIIEAQTAAQLTLQGLSAVRAGALCAAVVDPPLEGKLPSCVEVRPSIDGSLDVFYLVTVETKITKKKESWPLGSRPVGSTYLPLPVQAIDVLTRLLEPWRRLGGTRSLLLTFSAARGLPKSRSSIGKMTADTLTVMGREFVLKYCDTRNFDPETYRDIVSELGFRGHRFRNTFARFLFRTNSKLVPALSQHFRHLSIAMTERRYVGTDVDMLEAMDSERVFATAHLFQSILSGEELASGLGAKLIREHADALRAQIAVSEGETDFDRIVSFLKREEILIWPNGNGDCVINLMPRSAACHAAAGTSHWRQRAPNLAVRTPSLCAGCRCNVVTARNLEFWRKRLSDLSRVLTSNEADSDAFYAIRKRARQAEAMVRIHGKKS